MTSALLFLGFVGIKVYFEYSDYVIGSLCLQAYDTDKRPVAAEANKERGASSATSAMLSALM